MAELTAFGREVRKLRIDKGVSLMEMADDLGWSAAFVSSVETGRKDPPEEYVSRVVKFFGLTGNNAEQLRKIALQSRNVVRLKLQPKNQEVVAEFARKFNSLDKRDMDEILSILRRAQEK